MSEDVPIGLICYGTGSRSIIGHLSSISSASGKASFKNITGSRSDINCEIIYNIKAGDILNFVVDGSLWLASIAIFKYNGTLANFKLFEEHNVNQTTNIDIRTSFLNLFTFDNDIDNGILLYSVQDYRCIDNQISSGAFAINNQLNDNCLKYMSCGLYRYNDTNYGGLYVLELKDIKKGDVLQIIGEKSYYIKGNFSIITPY